MESIVHNILKQQNYTLLSKIAEDRGLCKNYLLKKYWTPTFYLIGKDMTSIYEIQHHESGKDQKKSVPH